MSYEDKLRAKIAATELANRAVPKTDLANQFVSAATADMQWQQNFIQDTNSHKALFGERRGGKTTLMAIAGIEQCLRVPYSKVLYIGLTQDSCEKVMYNEILARLIRQFQLPAKLVGGDQMRFDNGSILYLIGLDANKKQKEKVRGIKSSLNMIDEMQSYTQDTQLIINEVLGPAAADTKAHTILGGTAGNSLGENYWYQITRYNTKENPIAPSILHPEWIVYRCMWENNTSIDELTGKRVCDNVREYLNEQKEKHPGIETTDSWRQEWEAVWIVQTTALIYRYNDNLAKSYEEPSIKFLSDANYVLGLDLGYNDPTAMTVVAYNIKFSNKLYVIRTFQSSELLVPQVAAKIKELDKIYNFTKMVGDSSSLQVFETLKQDYQLPIEKANRQGKRSHQLVLNSDLQMRSVIIMQGNDDLISQLKTCIWDNNALKKNDYKEDPKYKNDLSDSFLYAHHASRHLWYEAPASKLNPLTMTREYHEQELTKHLIERNQSSEYGIDFAEPNSSYHNSHRNDF